MNLESWLTASHIVLFIGAIVGGIGGLGSYLFRKKLKKRKGHSWTWNINRARWTSWLDVSHTAIFVGLVMTAFGGLGSHLIGDKITEDNEKRAALSGTIVPPSLGTPPEILTVIFGGNQFLHKSNDYIAGHSVSPISSLLGSEHEIAFRKGEDRVLVSTTVTSIDGKVVAEIRENEWVINPNNYFKRSYTENGLVVVDAYNLPILKVDVIDEGTVVLQGIFIGRNQVTIATKDAMRHLTGRQPSLQEIRNTLRAMTTD